MESAPDKKKSGHDSVIHCILFKQENVVFWGRKMEAFSFNFLFKVALQLK